MKKQEEKIAGEENNQKLEKCGVIMPISAIDNYTEQHWIDVKNILFETIRSAGFEADLVSNSDDIGIIQKRIIQNIYENPIIVCDVSGKNPNVMFELGMRLAFDKPVIIIKDTATSYSFDTSPIEHLTYPRDLRFNKIIEFKDNLKEKILGTYRKAKEDPNYTTFLKNFGKFTVAKLETTEISREEYLLEELREMRYAVNRLLKNERTSKNFWNDDINEEKHHLRCEEDIERLINEELLISPNIPKSVLRDILTEKIMQNDLIPCFDKEKRACQSKLRQMINKYWKLEE